MMSLARYGTVTKAEIETVSRATVAGLKSCGLTSCLVGGAACMTYGMTRVPNDIDIVVLDSGLTPEEIKRRLVSANPSFFLVPSTNPRNTYKVLWYNLRATSCLFPPSHACKVDVLVPGVLNIPSMPKHYIVHDPITRIPVMPFIAVLLLKLQGWADHRVSRRVDLQMKQYVDVRDICELLRIVTQDSEVHIRKESWLPESFVAAGRQRVAEFVLWHSDTSVHWRQIGLLVTDGKSAGRSKRQTSGLNLGLYN